MGVKLKNNVVGYLNSTINASDIYITLKTGNGDNFPVLGVGDYFYATIVSSANLFEIVKVTSRVGDILTVIRGQESTISNSFAAGARVEMRVTAQSVIDAVTQTNVQSEYQTFVGTGATNTFTLSSAPMDPNAALVIVNGLVLTFITDYTITGTSLIFTTTPAFNDHIVVRWVPATGFLPPIIIVTTPQVTSFNAAVNVIYPVDTDTGSLTAVLPPSPTQGDRIGFFDASGTWDVNNLIVDGNGQLILDSATDLIADVKWGTPMLVWDSSRGWVLAP